MNIVKIDPKEVMNHLDVDAKINQVKSIINKIAWIMSAILVLQVIAINTGIIAIEFKGFYIGEVPHTRAFDRALDSYTPGAKKVLLDSAYEANNFITKTVQKTGSSALDTTEEVLSNNKESGDYSWTKVELTPKIRQEYIDKVAPIAIKMSEDDGIPASIKIAQACVESRYGTSRLAKLSNNHFGIKCHSKICRKGHCTRANDDHHKDFFRNFVTIEESFKGHTIVLQKPRYKKLFQIPRKNGKPDTVKWAKELKRAGYATSKRYPKLLQDKIEQHNLTKYDDRYLN